MNKKRPVNLDLISMKYPPMAIASILHRISGIILFLLLPVMLFILGKSLQSEARFADTIVMLTHPIYKFVVWAFGAAMIYHVLAGFRHIFMDMGLGEHLKPARTSAIAVIIVSAFLMIFLGIWIW